MKINPAKVERLLRAIHAVFSFEEWNAGLLLRRTSGENLKTPKGRELKEALRSAAGGGRLTKQRVGQLLNRDMEGEASEEANLKLVARYDAHRELWIYKLEEIRTRKELDAEAKAALRELENREDERAASFEAELDSLPPDKALDKLERHIEREQRNIEKLEERLRRADAAEERREFRKLERQHEAARRDLTRVAAALGQPVPARHMLGRGEELERDIVAYREELARLKGSDDYQRIAAEIARTPHTVTPELVRTIKQIESLRNGQHWRAGMSVNPGDYVDYSSGRAARAWEPSKLRPAVHLTPSWTPLKF